MVSIICAEVKDWYVHQHSAELFWKKNSLQNVTKDPDFTSGIFTCLYTIHDNVETTKLNYPIRNLTLVNNGKNIFFRQLYKELALESSNKSPEIRLF